MDKLWTSENISKGGIIGLLLVILVTGATGVWVYGPYYTEVKKERDEWKQVALEGLQVSRTVGAVKPILQSAPPEELTPEEVKSQLETVKKLNE